MLIAPMAADAKEAIGSMGNDAALAVLSDRHPPLFSYFKQLFAQVTNPPIDSVRETVVMSLSTLLGPEGDLLEETPDQARRLEIDQPVLRDSDLARIRAVSEGPLRSRTLDATWPLEEGADGLEAALDRLCDEADETLAEGAGIIVLSDRATSATNVPIPSLLAVSAVHHHLVRAGTRTRAGLVVESGEPREVHHVAALIGYGAGAVNPYLMIESLGHLEGRAQPERKGTAVGDYGGAGEDLEGAVDRVIAATGKALLKIMSKMGISTIRSYTGAQVFEAVGLNAELVERHFAGTRSSIGGVGIAELAAEALHRHARAWPDEHGSALPDHVEDALLPAAHAKLLPQGGLYAWRRDGERHMWDPETVASLQRVARGGGPEAYEEFSRRVNEENAAQGMLRGLMRLRPAAEPVPLDEVEPVAEIVKRFVTGGMSLGSLSPESHETLAVAMNRLGGKSNTGEGGEDPARFTADPNGDLRRSAIKQVASGRFGVTIDYLVNADQLQIKISQGSKPGEGGQLPGHKVDETIARLRLSTPGVELISPPPHHDIYSIEDLKQLVYDLRHANPRASVSVKLAAEVGVGTVAAGVAKANADHVVIAGHDGGTGASALSSIQGAGRAVGDRPGRDPADAGAQRPALARGRADRRPDPHRPRRGDRRAAGRRRGRLLHRPAGGHGLRDDARLPPEHLPRGDRDAGPRAARALHRPARARGELPARGGPGGARDHGHAGRAQVRGPDRPAGAAGGRPGDRALEGARRGPHRPAGRARGAGQRAAAPGPAAGVRCSTTRSITCRSSRPRARRSRAASRCSWRWRSPTCTAPWAALLSGEIVRRHGPEGLPEGSVDVTFRGSAGQSFGAWLAPGVTLTVNGAVNDYAGKGLSGGTIAVRPPDDARFVAEENVIAGNVALYGATSGRAFFRGLAGERFAVRNSGACAVVEGVGDHGCEYMTGGRVAVLGPVGVNFAAGMSGGVAWVLDPRNELAGRANTALVDLEDVGAEQSEELRALLAEHLERTGSAVARGAARRLGPVDHALHPGDAARLPRRAAARPPSGIRPPRAGSAPAGAAA